MQVSPVDIQAWASDTGSDYPVTPADKAMVLPIVAAWKAEQLQDAKEARGSNALATPLMVAGGVGLGLAGLAAFRHYKNQGLSDAAAGQKAKTDETIVKAATAAGAPAAAPAATGPLRAVDAASRFIRQRPEGFNGPRLRGRDQDAPPDTGASEPTAYELVLSQKNTPMGSAHAREQGQYKARTEEGFHNPALASLDTPEKREAYLASLLEAHGSDSDVFQNARDAIAAMEVQTGTGVDPRSFIGGLSNQERYGTTTAAEKADRGGHLQQSRTKSNKSAQAGFRSRDNGLAHGIRVRRETAHPFAALSALAAAGDEDRSSSSLIKKLDKNGRPVGPALDDGDVAARELSSELKGVAKDLKLQNVSPGEVRLRRALFDGPGLIAGIEQAIGQPLSAQDREWVQRSGRLWKEQRGSAGFGGFAGDLQQHLGVALNAGQSKAIRSAFAADRVLPAENLKRLQQVAAGGVAGEPVPIRGFGAGFGDAARGIDLQKASNFYLDSDGELRPYLGPNPVHDVDGPLQIGWTPKQPEFVKGVNGEWTGEVRNPKPGETEPLRYTGKKRDGSTIAESDLVYLPTDDFDFYTKTDLRHPYLGLEQIAQNSSQKRQDAFAVGDDAGIAGLREPLNSLGAVYHHPTAEEKEQYGNTWKPRVESRLGVDEDDPTSRLVYGSNGAGERVPLDLSFQMSEMEAPGAFAGGRLRRALDDYKASTGQPLSESNVVTLAGDLARQHGVDTATVLRGAGFTSTAPEPERTPRVQAHALGGGNSADHLDRVYRSLGMHAGADAWELEGMIRSGDIRGAANALAPLIPAFTQVNGKFLRGASQDEKLNIVAEGLTAGLHDLSVTLQKYPQMAEQFGIGKGSGGFGVDAYIKSYIRDYATVRSLQLDPSGQPTYQVPVDAFELMAYEGNKSGRGTIEAIEDEIRGSRNGLEAALRIDRLVSAAQSSKEGDPNTNATNFAQTVFSMEDSDMISTQLAREAAGDVRLSFATRRPFDATAGFLDKNPTEALITERIAEQEIPGFSNAALTARLKGIDTKSPDAKSRVEEVKMAQKWIADNAERLERDREDLNRGIVNTDQGPHSVGRGLVVSSGDRGAFLAGNTQGMHTSYREELINDEDVMPLDRAQDFAREAILNNQLDNTLDPTKLPDASEAPELDPVPLRSEADRTAAEYGGQKLYFKNLGPQSRGAMPEGEAKAPLQHAQRYLSQLEEDRGYRGQLTEDARSFERFGGILGGWQPSQPLGNGNEIVKRDTTQWIAPSPSEDLQQAGRMSGSWETAASSSPGLTVDLGDGPVPILTPDGSRGLTKEQRAMAGLPPVPPSGPGIDPHGTYGKRGVHSVERPPGNLFDPDALVPRSEVAVVDNTATAARHREALEARAINGGEGFRDDQRMRDGLASRPPATMYDRGEVSGYGRQGTQDWGVDPATGQALGGQKPIAAAPVSAVPAAALEQLNTLSASLERPVADYTQQELSDARARHIGDWISKAATPGHNSRGAQTSGWTGGDSWRGGARLAGRANQNIKPYTPASDAMLQTLAKLARRPAGAI